MEQVTVFFRPGLIDAIEPCTCLNFFSIRLTEISIIHLVLDTEFGIKFFGFSYFSFDLDHFGFVQ